MSKEQEIIYERLRAQWVADAKAFASQEPLLAMAFERSGEERLTAAEEGLTQARSALEHEQKGRHEEQQSAAAELGELRRELEETRLRAEQERLLGLDELRRSMAELQRELRASKPITTPSVQYAEGERKRLEGLGWSKSASG